MGAKASTTRAARTLNGEGCIRENVWVGSGEKSVFVNTTLEAGLLLFMRHQLIGDLKAAQVGVWLLFSTRHTNPLGTCRKHSSRLLSMLDPV